MTHPDNLTADWKIMNMTKPGIVARSLKTWTNPCKPVLARLCGLMRYTLCEVGRTETRNGSRYGFGFYSPGYRRTTPASSFGLSRVRGNFQNIFTLRCCDFTVAARSRQHWPMPKRRNPACKTDLTLMLPCRAAHQYGHGAVVPICRGFARCFHRAEAASLHPEHPADCKETSEDLPVRSDGAHTHSAVEHGRDQTRRAISKGLALPEDLKASDTLWLLPVKHHTGFILSVRGKYATVATGLADDLKNS